ncbi:hypothetical protein PG984_013442 [Apiospora sp. TS-2023a]
MALDDFPQFTRLPKELQHEVWKLAVVEENKGRILCLHKDTNRVIPTMSRLLAPSPVFRVTQQSRFIAKMVYSTPLTIVKTPPHRKALEEHFSTENCDEVGTIRISWEHDTFLLGYGFSDFRFFSEIMLGGRFTTAPMADDDLKKVKNVIEFQDHQSSPHKIVKFDTNRFPRVDTYYYIEGISNADISSLIPTCYVVMGCFDRLQGSVASRLRDLNGGFTDRIVGPVSVSNGRKTDEKSGKSLAQKAKG